MLSFRGQDISNKEWRVSMMIGVPTTDNLREHIVTMLGNEIPGEIIYQTKSNHLTFLVYNLSIKQTNEEQEILYTVNKIAFGFLVPAIGQSTRWAFWSCNGYQSLPSKKKLNGIQPMWRQLLNSGKLHMMYGGGDQLYMDGIVSDSKTSGISHEGLFSLPLFNKWLHLNISEQRKAEFTPEFSSEVYEFAVQHYIDSFIEPEYSNALASIPSIMSWDDHDTWDGAGSYKTLNDSPVSFFVPKKEKIFIFVCF